MYDPRFPEDYFEVGRQALERVRTALNGTEPKRILDLPCGHGRVLRWLEAAYPRSELSACDISRGAVDFCAREFGARPIYSALEPEDIALEGPYDLIWCGSLLTHVDAPLWAPFLELFTEHLSGALVFTTGGTYTAELIREGEPGINETIDAEPLLRSYDSTGFGFAPYHPVYHHTPSYGLARATPEWVLNLLTTLPLEVVSVAERGWGDRQDVYTVQSNTRR